MCLKILYIANEDSDAHVAATVLHGFAPDVTLNWASHFDQAADWIYENRDVAVLVLEAHVDGQSCTPFLKHVRRLGLSAPVVVIAPVEAAPRLETLKARGYDFVAKDHSLSRNLPDAVARAIERAHTRRMSKLCGARSVTAPAAETAALERRLVDLEASFHEREQLWAAEQSAAAERQATLEGLLHQERAASADLAQRFAHSEAALRNAAQRHLSAMTAATRQLADRETEYEASAARAAATRDMVDEQLREAAAAVEQARRNQASADAEVDRLSRRQSELSFLLATVTASHGSLEGQLADAETALAAANERAARQQLAASKQAAERQTAFETQLGAVSTARDAVAEEARDLQAALGAVRVELELHAATVERLTAAEAELTSRLTEAVASREALEHRLTGAATALEEANEHATRERLAAAGRAAEREAELDALIGQERATRANVERTLAHVEGARREAEDRHATAMTAADRKLAETRLRFEAELSAIATARDRLTQQLSETELAVEGARQDHASAAADVARLTQRHVELDGLIRQEQAARADVEQERARLEGALFESEQRHASAIAAAATELAERRRQFETELSAIAAVRDSLAHQLSNTERAAEEARQHHASAAADVARLTQRETDLDGLLLEERTACASIEQTLAHVEGALREAEQHHAAAMTAAATELAESRLRFETELSEAATTRDRLTQQLSDTELAVEGARRDHASAAADVARLTQREAELSGLLLEERTTRASVEQTLAHVEGALREAEQRHAAAVTTAAVELSDAATAIREANDRAATAAERLAGVETQLTQERQRRETLELELTEARGEMLERLRAFAVERDSLEEARGQLQGALESTNQELEKTRAELRRPFEHSPTALCRYTRDGALIDANRAYAVLAGYRTADELRGADFAATVFESPDDLTWLIERCLSTGATESAETTWKARNGGRLSMRLTAVAASADVIEIVAEDITTLRALQERLGQAQRIEAVGRIASEVSVTCGNLLRDIHQNAQQWILTACGEGLQRQGEMLLDDLTRAAGFLRQLAAYSDEEASALAPVDLNRVLRDLEPVLKRVAGDAVELELPKKASPLDVDVKAERVERLLVNLANYGRERMPSGGRLRIDLAAVVVDRRFLAKYPNVRRGPHALITVTEARRTMRAAGLFRRRAEPAEPSADRPATERPGVDLGALQGLIQECSGHLWMRVGPPGEMVVKIHLPLGASDDPAHPGTAGIGKNRGRTLARWFQH